MKNLTKIKSYYGLSVRARKIAIGTNEVLENKCKLIVASTALSENAINKIKNHKNIKTRLEILSQDDILFITENSKILVFGVTDKGLANAIINNL